MRGDEGVSISPHQLEKEGLPLSPHLAFGEVVALFDAEDLGIGPDWPKALRELLDTPRLYPECWPSGFATQRRSPKILILDENAFHRMRNISADELIGDVAGVISTNSGMTSHLAIMSRGLGIGAIACALSEEERTNTKMALFQGGRLKLYRGLPDLSENDFNSLVAAMERLKRTGD